jgi:TonB family protein
MSIRIRVLTLVPAFSMAAALGATAADLTKVKALYAGASYEDALAELQSDMPSADPDQADEYAALCLLALGRSSDAEQAIERLVSRSPLASLPEGDTSPRLLEMFQRVRTRMLPSVTRSAYQRAKEAFDAAHFDAAESGFRTVVDLIGHDEGADPSVADLKVLAQGFLQLAQLQRAPSAPVAAAAPPPPASTPISTPAKVATDSAVAATEVRENDNRLYSSTDRDVTAPVAVERQMPVWKALPPPFNKVSFHGRVELVINAQGAVESARITERTTPAYDEELLAAARRWKFRPASRDGHPVRFREDVAVVLTSP